MLSDDVHADQFIEYVTGKEGCSEETPFGPEALVYKVAGKVFAIVGTMGSENEQLRANLKCAPPRAERLRESFPESVLPGYHMNKRHWNTIVLDGRLDPELVRELVDHSYELVVAGLPAATRESLAGE